MFTIIYKELAKNLIDQIPDSKMYYIVAYLQGAAIPEEIPNADTIASIEELELDIFTTELIYEVIESAPVGSTQEELLETLLERKQNTLVY